VKTLNDFWKFDIDLKRWTAITDTNNAQLHEVIISLTKPRRNTTLSVFNNHLFVFGGIQDVTK
jgi:hypothetical protein